MPDSTIRFRRRNRPLPLRRPGFAPAPRLLRWAAGVWLFLAVPAWSGPARAVVEVAVTVSDMDRALVFYTQVLPFQVVSDVELSGDEIERFQGVFGLRLRAVTLRLGEETLTLRDVLAPEGRPLPPDSRSHDRWFQHVAIIVSDMDRAYAVLREHTVQHASTGPQTLPDWNPNAGGIRAFYFQDPDGHNLEILWFPPGKGNPRWHRPTGDLFLGIDHTAIVVEDTERSLTFYRDLLGMEVAGGSENYGPEQERLNNVFGARLRITTLKTTEGPGVELLEYLAPSTGRPFPVEAEANDLLHWETRVQVADVAALEPAVLAADVELLGSRPVSFPQKELGFSRGLVVRDPDGHAVALVDAAALAAR